MCFTILINLTPFDWNDHDKRVHKSATKICQIKYQSDCVKKFIKKGKKNYHAICGNVDKK